jgi:aminopeptidase
VTRADLENPVQAWNEHLQKLEQKLTYLNSKKFKKLHYSAPGTDLSIELPERHVWLGGGLHNAKGTVFVPNIPTEEVFTLPKKDGVNGVVSSTKPLSYNGTIIENFSLTFENGKIVDFKAEKGYETLQKLIETDEGSKYLGEVALVPHHSPISESNVIFFSTLFDENASNHLAIGAAYPTTLENGTSMSKEELAQHGANASLSHVDFMIGSAEMNVDAETSDGQRIPLMRNGDWAI